MSNRTINFLFLFCLFVTISCSNKENVNSKAPVIFCAASLSGVMDELNDTLNSAGQTPIINIASSGTLARQIAQGGMADVFISANYKWAGYIDSLGLADTIVPFAKNSLVCIGTVREEKDSVLNFSGMKRIAIGNPAHVPVGEYTREYLLQIGQYNQLKEKFIYTKDVKSALRLVEMKECDAGFVYKSDALSSNKVQIIMTPPDSLYSDVIIFLIKLKSADSSVFNGLSSAESKRILKKHGFEPL